MSSVEDIKYMIDEAHSQIGSISEELGDLEELEEAMGLWSEIENEFGDAEDVGAQLRIHSDVSSGLEYHGISIDTEAGVEELMRIVESAKKKDEVTNAISQFVSALTSAGILPGTEVVPTPVSTEEPAVADNVVSAAPSFTNQTNNKE